MKKRFLLALSILMIAISPAMAKPLNDSIVAIVNNDVITIKDLKDYIGSIYRQLKVENHTPAEIKEIMSSYEEKGVNQLVEDKLILAAANDKGLVIRDDIIRKRLAEIQTRYKSEDDFIKGLDSQGMTLNDLKKKMVNQLKARYIVDIEVKQKVFVNPQDVTAYYNEHAKDFTRKTKYTLDSIFISFDNGKQDARNKAAEARAKLAAGEDFDKVFKQYSQAPSVGSIEQGQMVPSIEKEIFSLNVEDVSKPIEVDGGIYVFKVTGVLPGRIETLEEVKDKIQDKLFDDIFQTKFREWIEKLRKKNYVEIRD